MRSKILSLGLIAGVCITVTSCLKNSSSTPSCTPTTVNVNAPDSEVNRLKTYLGSKGLSATQDPRGFFYTMDSATIASGTGATTCSNIAFTYSGRFLDSTKAFDSSAQTVVYQLRQLITGWQEAIPFMRKNATMRLYLPPALAYGYTDVKDQTTGVVRVPASSYLIFDIKLYDFD